VAVESVAKAGTIGVIEGYPPTFEAFPFGQAFDENLPIKAGACHHRRYQPELVELVATEAADLSVLITEHEPMTDVVAAYEEFDRREPGRLKVSVGPDR
jgi:threonine dehydrogenase-like Zn-dependent dehydrogenase